jgi:hypothetical protein
LGECFDDELLVLAKEEKCSRLSCGFTQAGDRVDVIGKQQ